MDYKYYDAIAKGYDKLHSEEQDAKFSAILNELVKYGLNKNSDLLDIGCGTLRSFDFFPCEVFGIEPSKEMAKQHPEYKELIRKGKLIICGVENIMNCFKQKKFDFIVSITAAHHFKDKEKALSDIKKRLKNKGTVAFSLLKNTDKEYEKYMKKHFIINKIISPQKNQKDTIIICSNKTL